MSKRKPFDYENGIPSSERRMRSKRQYFGYAADRPKVKTVMPTDVSEYAAEKARRLTIEQFEAAGLSGHAMEYRNGTFVTNPMVAFARYIDRME